MDNCEYNDIKEDIEDDIKDVKFIRVHKFDIKAMSNELSRLINDHPTTNVCPDQECELCSIRDCPFKNAFHYHHDGCPYCLRNLNNIYNNYDE